MSMKEKLAVTVLVTTLALFGLVVVLYRMIKDKNEDYTQIVLNQHSSNTTSYINTMELGKQRIELLKEYKIIK